MRWGNMEQITEFCTGCRMCEQVCPHKCISMAQDKEGFLFPKINQEKCVNCGLCAKKCPQNQTEKLIFDVKKTLAAKLKDEKTLHMSASGGVFAGLAIAAIREGWIVFGAAYDENMNVKHMKAAAIDELQPLLNSKYVQCNTVDSFSEVKRLLKEGKKVLYSGTPCQIAGLRSFVGASNPNLLLVDIICHGVPSQLLFSKYLELLKQKHNCAGITEFTFRDKRGGWGLGYKYKYGSKFKYGNCTDDPYYMYFLEGHIYRECCYSCHYSQRKRPGDITIADYWGIEKYHPEFYSTKGVSLVLLNTEKGMQAWNRACGEFDFLESNLEYACRGNHNLNAPTRRVSSVRDSVYNEINELPVEEYFRKHLPYKQSFMSKIKSVVPMNIKLFLKSLKK